MGDFKLKRVHDIILSAIEEHPWESQAAFNPGAVRENDVLHLLYRGVKKENKSSIGYARMTQFGIPIYRYPEPAITPSFDVERHGCEDPRIVPFEDKYYIFYTGFDGEFPERGENARIMLAETEDFKSFKKHGMIGPDIQDKDAMIFPEKIGGKVMFLHRIEPNIQLAEFEEMKCLQQPEAGYWQRHLENLEKHTILRPAQNWETRKIGTGPPPIRTEAGWLLVYHGVDKNSAYRAGAALLDEKNPRKVIARLPYPILEPEREYEKVGDVNNVVFPQGMVQFDDDLHIYYGGADKVVGLAKGKLSRLLDALWQHKVL